MFDFKLIDEARIKVEIIQLYIEEIEYFTKILRLINENNTVDLNDNLKRLFDFVANEQNDIVKKCSVEIKFIINAANSFYEYSKNQYPKLLKEWNDNLKVLNDKENKTNDEILELGRLEIQYSEVIKTFDKYFSLVNETITPKLNAMTLYVNNNLI